MYKKIIILLLLGLSSVCLHAQNTTGIWKGTMYDDTTKLYMPCEIVITEKNGFVSGYSYVTHEQDGKQVQLLKKIKLNFRGNNLGFDDMVVLLGDSSFPEAKQTKLSFATAITGSGVALAMNGIWKTAKSNTGKKRTGTLSLYKVDDFTEAEVFTQLQNLDLAKSLSFVRKRPRPQDKDIEEIPVTAAVKLPVNSDELKQEIENKVVAKTTPVVPIKDAAAVIKEEDKALVAVVEEKKLNAAVKPPEEKKTPPAIVKPIPEKKEPTVVAVVKPVPPKKEPVVTKPVPAVIKKTEPPVAVIKPNPPKQTSVIAKPVSPPPVTVVVKKPEPPPVVVKKDLPIQVFELPAKDVATDVLERKTITKQTVEYQSDSLTLTLYDNGEIDGDTVSVLMNGKVLFSKVGLTTKPNRKTIYMDKDTPDSLTMVMYAENMGSIPPNTGLLVVWDGELVYELRFSADLKSNAAIIFRRKPKE